MEDQSPENGEIQSAIILLGIKNKDIHGISGWWLTYPSEKYEFVSWDDDIPNWMEKSKMFQTTNQDIPSREQT